MPLAVTLLLLCGASVLAIAYLVSAVSGLGMALAAGRIAELSPRGQSRVYLGLAWLPLLLGVLCTITALAPSFGWVADHCLAPTEDTHHHLCLSHGALHWSGPWLLLLGGIFSTKLVWTLTGVLMRGWQGRQLKQKLMATSRESAEGYHVLGLDEPQAFVVGTLGPVIFISRGLLAPEHREHLEAVLAHERAHLQNRDPLQRLVTQLALIFHLPGLAGWIQRNLSRTQEMAADASAAEELASAEQVAAAIVSLARWQTIEAAPIAAVFTGSEIEARVNRLLDEPPAGDQPSVQFLMTLAILLLALITLSVDPIHHGVELLLGALNH